MVKIRQVVQSTGTGRERVAGGPVEEFDMWGSKTPKNIWGIPLDLAIEENVTSLLTGNLNALGYPASINKYIS